MRQYIRATAGYLSASLAMIHINPALATDFTAKTVMEKMPAEQRYPYLAGVVEGLAYARYVRDGKQTTGMECIYDWFYKKPETINLIYAALGKYQDFTPGAVIEALTHKPCGN